MSKLKYTHEEMINICDEAKRMMICEFDSMLDNLGRDVSGECVWVDKIKQGIVDIKENNGLTDR